MFSPGLDSVEQSPATGIGLAHQVGAPRPDSRLARLFPGGVSVAMLDLDGVAEIDDRVGNRAGLDCENELVRATSQRRREYSAGRVCARRALGYFGHEQAPLPRDADRVPIWPHGIVGSLSHCTDLCVAAVARAQVFHGIGIDVECAGELGCDLNDMICTNDEMAFARVTPAPRASGWSKVIFSAKESVYKCLYPAHRIPFDFLDVRLSIDPERGTFRAKIVFEGSQVGPRQGISGRFHCTSSHILTSAFTHA